MAGHSKFKNIMHRKGAQDKKRSALFSKLSREITVAAKTGLPDPDANARLRAAVNAAKAQSMPKDNIQRAIDKAAAGGGENYEEVRYEGYAPGGAAISAVVMRDLPVHEYAASEIKLAVVGRGGAQKEQVQHMVGLMLNLGGKLQADAADALAVAITHAHVRASAARLGVGVRQAWGRR